MEEFLIIGNVAHEFLVPVKNDIGIITGGEDFFKDAFEAEICFKKFGGVFYRKVRVTKDSYNNDCVYFKLQYEDEVEEWERIKEVAQAHMMD